MIPGLNPWGFYLLLTIGMPLAFRYDSPITDNNEQRNFRSTLGRFDRWLGDLSYPLYISHTLIIILAYGFFLDFAYYGDVTIHTLTLITASVALAALLQYYAQTPIDRYRSRRLKQAPTPGKSRAARRRARRKAA